MLSATTAMIIFDRCFASNGRNDGSALNEDGQ